jgi:hypothetical protein
MSDYESPPSFGEEQPLRLKRCLYAIWAVIYGVLGLLLLVPAGVIISSGSLPILFHVVLGFVLLLPSCAAAVCGHLALSRIRESDGRLRGTRWATTGLAMGYAVLLVVIAGLANVIVERSTSPGGAAATTAGGDGSAGTLPPSGDTNQTVATTKPASTNNEDAGTLLLNLPAGGPAVVPSPQGNEPNLVICVREIEAFDPKNPSKSIGRFGVNTPLVIGEKDPASGKYRVIFKTSRGAEIKGLCNAADLGK